MMKGTVIDISPTISFGFRATDKYNICLCKYLGRDLQQCASGRDLQAICKREQEGFAAINKREGLAAICKQEQEVLAAVWKRDGFATICKQDGYSTICKQEGFESICQGEGFAIICR